MANPPDRPLALGEILAETVRLYGERVWAAFGIGGLVAAGFLVAGLVHPIAAISLVALVVTVAWAVATRLVAGDPFGEAWSRVGGHAPELLVFTAVASLPFAVAVSELVFIIFAVAWLALTGFAIPVAVTERDPAATGLFHRLAFGLRRSIELARAEYLHAAGVIAAVVILYILLGVILAGAIAGFAENGGLAAVALAQVVLAPMFFLSLGILYFEQRARAAGPARTRTPGKNPTGNQGSS